MTAYGSHTLEIFIVADKLNCQILVTWQSCARKQPPSQTAPAARSDHSCPLVVHAGTAQTPAVAPLSETLWHTSSDICYK
jgi:hypothetical protein